jgi:16S rRNA (uracil1498-N3)-methyltransferase
VSERFYCPVPPQAGRFHLERDESRHLAKVCRLGIGDRVELFDGRGFATAAEIIAVKVDRVDLVALGEPLASPEPPSPCVLATAVPKGDRFDWLVEKATELGVERLIPLVTERSVVVPRGSKLDRLRRTIIEASKQCRRASLMVLEEPMEWTALVAAFPEALKFVADRDGVPPSAWPTIPRGREAMLAVGPEGGLTREETELATGSGWLPIRLAYNTLRVETAGLAGCAALLTRLPEIHE